LPLLLFTGQLAELKAVYHRFEFQHNIT